VPGYEASGWCGVVAPKNTSTEIVDRLYKEIGAGLADPKFRAQLASLGVTPLPLSPLGHAMNSQTSTRAPPHGVLLATLAWRVPAKGLSS
jgi:hypothetical protein